MNLSSFATLFLGLLAAASAMDMIALDEGQLAEIELRRQAKGSSKLDCEQVKILLTNERVDAGQSSEVRANGRPKAFDRQGGVIAFSDPNDADIVLGDYTYLITFLDDSFGCVANGAYTWFRTGDQLSRHHAVVSRTLPLPVAEESILELKALSNLGYLRMMTLESFTRSTFAASETMLCHLNLRSHRSL